MDDEPCGGVKAIVHGAMGDRERLAVVEASLYRGSVACPRSTTHNLGFPQPPLAGDRFGFEA